jgi:ABC-type oligopeptide transport system substrate-binding subunit
MTKAKAQQAKIATAEKITLRYPAGDPAVQKACEMIQSQIQAVDTTNPIRLELVPCSPRDLKHDVEETHQYDLAYYYYDYPTPAYWLWPLFDSEGNGGGRNFMGYEDSKMRDYFHKIMAHRDFTMVRNETHVIHDLFLNGMPFIPLWQLDTHVAIHKSVKHPDLSRLGDPLLIFSDIDKWAVEK